MTQFSRSIRSVVIGALAFGGAAGVVGCTSNPPPAKTTSTGFRSDVTDIRPVEPSAYQPPLYDTSAVIPVAPQPMAADAAPVASSVVPVTTIMATTPATGGNIHIVRHGETLFSIARTKYGTGSSWKKIAAANPGVSASKLRVGQKLVMP